MHFEYSDTGYIVLGKLVERVAGEPLDRYADRMFYAPLRMTRTRFLPPPDWIPQIAPTEEIDLPPGEQPGSGKGHVLRGEVHDPTARAMGGVAGNAGLFSSADDLARFCQMMLDDGAIAKAPGQPAGRRIFAAETVERAVLPENPPLGSVTARLRLGHRFRFFLAAGRTFPDWFLWPYRVHRHFRMARSREPHIRGAAHQRCASVPAASHLQSAIESRHGCGRQRRRFAARHGAFGGRAQRWRAPFRLWPRAALPAELHTQTGIDVLEAQHFAPLQGKHVGLITNQTGVDSLGRRTIDVLAKAEGVKLVALFSPEHGIEGVADARLKSTTDAATGLPIYSLYGDTMRPTADMLRGVDALVFDVQDAGVRFYTYITTMAYVPGSSRPAAHPVLRARPSRSARWRRNRRSDAGPRPLELHRLFPHAGPLRDDAGRIGANV